MPEDPIDIAYLVSPGLSGVWSVYRQLRGALAPHGLRLRWVGVGTSADAVAADPAWAAELAHGECIERDPTDGASPGVVAVRRLASRDRYRAVVVNTLMDGEQMNIVRYLPQDLARVMIVHSITPATYSASAALRDYVNLTVGVAPRVRDDLVGRFGFSPERFAVIPNALDLGPYHEPVRQPSAALRLVTLGRVEEAAKGVFWLPGIMRRLRDVDCRLTVAGDGPALAELRRRCVSEQVADRVAFLGAVPPVDVPATLGAHDVYVLPSRFEACPVGMIESMAAGCVPVASRIRGATDAVAVDEREALFFPIGNVAAAAAQVRRLADDPALLRRMSAAARHAAHERFTLARMGAAYAEIFNRMLAPGAQPQVCPPLPLERWSYPRGFSPGIRRFVPSWAKNLARQWRS